MFYLENVKTGDSYYFLQNKNEYAVGRRNADIILKDDVSISNTHATITVSPEFVTIIDNGSKHGTFKFDKKNKKIKLKPKSDCVLRANEKIQFGALGTELVLNKLNIFTLISTLTLDQKMKLEQCLKIMNGKILNLWSDECTHLTMPSITVTIKLLQALVGNIPIVTPSYWELLLKNIQKCRAPPSTEEFLPSLAETFINNELISFQPNKCRKSIFSGKIFFFLSKKHCDTYTTLIHQAGGECKNLNEKGVRKTLLIKENSIVIQYIPSSQTQSSQSIETVSDYIKSHGLRIIPESEIGLSILHCSLEEYCNPKYDIANKFNQKSEDIEIKDILAKNTNLSDTEVFEEAGPNLQSIEIPCTNENPASNIEAENVIRSEKNNVIGDVGDYLELDVSTIENETLRKRKNSNEDINNQPNKKVKNILEDWGVESEKSVSTSKYASLEFLSKKKIITNKNTDNIRIEQLNKTNSNTSAKRTRIAILDNDNEDDLFDFGNVSKKKKPNRVAVSAPVENENSKIKKSVNDKKTAKNRTEIDANISKPEIIPIPIRSSGWLSKSTIKTELKLDDESEYDDTSIKKDIKKENDWIDSIMGGFIVKVKKMVIVSRSTLLTDSTELADNSNSTLNGKNFKAFTKKRNFKPQTQVLSTVSFHVPGNLY